jgi:hypothetical protein
MNNIRNTLKSFLDKERKLIVDILLYGVKKNEFTHDLLEHIDVTAYITVCSLRGISALMIFDEEEFNLIDDKEKSCALSDLIFKGLKA